MDDTYLFRAREWGDPVGAGATAPQYVTLDGVAKKNKGYIVANELICARLGLVLGLPVPPGVIVPTEDGSGLAYVSLRFGRAGERPPPIIPADFVADHPELAGHIVAFDCWIANTDRHNQNLAYSRGLIAPVVFDHSHAFLGSGNGNGVQHLANHDDKAVVSKCFRRDLSDPTGILAMSDRIESVSEQTVEGIVGQAHELGLLADDEAAAARSFLVKRKTEIADLIKGSGQLPKITDWGE